jgi:hypothetical protein
MVTGMAAQSDLDTVAAAPEHKKRKRKAKSPTARSVEELRKRGYPLVDVVEKRIPGCFITRDLWNIVDIIAVSETDILGVQATSGPNVAARVAKIAESEALPIVLKAGIRIAVWGWRKGADGHWVLREVEL